MRIPLLILSILIFLGSGLAQLPSDTLRTVSPIGHLGNINSSKIRGNILFTGSSDKTIKLWDLKSRKELKTIHPGPDIVYDFDVTKDGQYIVSSHQNSYIIIEGINQGMDKKQINFNTGEICEQVFFSSNDTFIVASVYSLSLDSSYIKVFNRFSIGELPQSEAVYFDNFQYSSDKGSWFFLLDSNSLSWNFIVRGEVKCRKFDFDFPIDNYTYDNVKKRLIVHGQHKLITLEADSEIQTAYDLAITNLIANKIEFIVPTIKDDFLVCIGASLYLFNRQSRSFSFLDSLGSGTLYFFQTSFDGRIFISSDYLYVFNESKNTFEKVLRLTDLESINFNVSDKYFAIQGQGIRLYSKLNPWTSYLDFDSPGKKKYDMHVSARGKNIAIMNENNSLEAFSISDFSSYNQLFHTSEITDFRISDMGYLFVLDDKEKVSVYDVNQKPFACVKKDILANVHAFSINEQNNEISIVTLANRRVKYALSDFRYISEERLSTKITSTFEISEQLNSYYELKSDNYSFCNIEFGSLGPGVAKHSVRCSTGISEGMFAHKLSEDGKYLLYVDEDNSFLNIVSVLSGTVVNKVSLNGLDEIVAVTMSEKLDIVVFSTLDDSVYSYSLKTSANTLLSVQHYSEVVDLKIDDQNNLLYMTSLDGNMYISDVQNVTPFLSMFSLSGGEYLFKLVNSSYYMGSKNASKKLHYVTPRLKVIGFEQLDLVFNRPDIIMKAISQKYPLVDNALIDDYHSLWTKRIQLQGFDAARMNNLSALAVPNAEILNADSLDGEGSQGYLNLKIKASDTAHSLRTFNVFINEVPLFSSTGIPISTRDVHVWDTTIQVKLTKGENKIQVAVMNDLGLESFKYPTYVKYIPVQDIKPRTIFVGIAVDRFQDTTKNLKYCVKDITDLANKFKAEHSIVYTFSNENVTRENIQKLKVLLNQTNINDRVIISCSSHGLLDDSLNFYLASSDIDFDSPRKRGIAYQDLEGLLDGIPARKKLLLLDACNSGGNDNSISSVPAQPVTTSSQNRFQTIMGRGFKPDSKSSSDRFRKINELFVNTRNNTGSVIIAAAGGRESALEDIEVGGKKITNGAFTFSVLEFLNTSQNVAKSLTVGNLKSYVESRVSEITRGKQRPTSRQETMEFDWGIFND